MFHQSALKDLRIFSASTTLWLAIVTMFGRVGQRHVGEQSDKGFDMENFEKILWSYFDSRGFRNSLPLFTHLDQILKALLRQLKITEY